ncbi:MAG: ThaI family type II restriction endonuclease, partial [Salinispira sp.]
MDVRVCGRSLSIKTKSNPGYGNVTLVWTVDWNRVDTFVKNYMPSSDLLYVNIIWDNDGGFFLIPQEVQQATWQRDKT